MKEHARKYYKILKNKFPDNNCSVEIRISGPTEVSWFFWVYPNAEQEERQKESTEGHSYCIFYTTVKAATSYKQLEKHLISALEAAKELN